MPLWRWPTGPRRARWRAGLGAGAAGRGRRGRRWRRRSCPGRGRRATPATEEKRTKAREVEVRGQLVQVPGGVGLGGEDALELLGGRASRSTPSSRTPAAWTTAPSGCSAGIASSSASSCVAVGDVAGGDVDLGAELVELGAQLLGALGLGAAAADQEQVADAVLSTRWRATGRRGRRCRR